MCDTQIVKGSEFLRKLKRLAHRQGLHLEYDPEICMGSHGRLRMGTSCTTLKDPKKELGKGLLRSMCHDLEIDPRDL